MGRKVGLCKNAMANAVSVRAGVLYTSHFSLPARVPRLTQPQSDQHVKLLPKFADGGVQR